MSKTMRALIEKEERELTSFSVPHSSDELEYSEFMDTKESSVKRLLDELFSFPINLKL